METSPAADPTRGWEIASCHIAEMTEASPEGVRDFLDFATAATSPTRSRTASTRAPLAAAIDAAARWKGWRIDRRTSRDEGIPRGLPYLTGWVTHFQILGETQALPAAIRHQRRGPFRGYVAGSGWSRPSRRRDEPMTKLSDTQLTILSAAASRADGNLLPLLPRGLWRGARP
jgi:hypothetical protein